MLIGAFVAVVVIFIATFRADNYKPRIVAAVQAATGRTLALNGPIGLKFSLHPTIEVRDVALANPPGFSRPDMVRMQAVDVQLGLLPLIRGRIEIGRLVLVHPDILLERTASGDTNWQFARPSPPSKTAQPPAAPRQHRPTQLAINDLRIDDGTLAYRDDRTGHTALIQLKTLRAEAPADAPVHMTANAVVNGLPFTVAAQTGSLHALQTPPAPPGWPVQAKLHAAGATLAVNGSVAEPMQGRGYAVTLNATIPDLAALAPFAPKAGLPPLHNVAVSAHLADTGGLPVVSALTLRAGSADLSSLAAGLTLQTLAFDAPSMDQPLHLTGSGSFAGTPVSLAATLGAPSRLLTGQPAGPFPIDLTAQAAGGNLTVKGTLAEPARLAGLDLALTGGIPDLSKLSPLAHRPLPALTNVAFQGTVSAPQLVTGPFQLQGMKLTTAQGDLSGSATIGLAPSSIRAQLSSTRLDLDALRAAQPRPAPASGPAAPAPAVAPPPPAPAARATHLIPDGKLPFDRLHGLNADITLAADTLITGGATWKQVSGHLVVQNDKLQLAPFHATLPAGPLDLSLSVDATRPAPPVAIKLRAPAAALQQLLALAGQPGVARGTVDVSADLTGSGDTPHAIAASLDGTLSATMQGGQIENRVLEAMLGKVIARANPIGLLERGSTSDIRCLAVRLTAHSGIATLNPFLLNSTLITVDGTGTLNFGNETLDLHLHPQGRIGGTGISIPLTVTGGFADPHVAMNRSGAAQGGVEMVIGALAGRSGLKLPGATAPSCAAALASARSGAPVPASASRPASPAPPAAAPKLPDAGALLRQLLHR